MAEPMSLDEGTPALDGEVEGVDEQELRYALLSRPGSICGHLQVTVIA